MNTSDYFYRFGLALGIGLLIGIQREAVYDEPEGKLFAGARTFPLFSLAGFVMALVSDHIGSGLPFLGGIVAVAVLLALAYYADVLVGKPGMTTETAAIVAYGTGGLCLWGPLPLAAALGVTVTAMLSLKHEFRSFTHSITREDIYATVKFAVISVIVLPLLPNRTFGPTPLNVLNPYNIWLMVIFISGISFLGYVLIKVVGARRGIGLTGLLGGIASSTAVTLSFSQRSHDSEELARPFALAILVAWGVMFVRVLVIVFTLAPELATGLIAPMAASAGVGLVYSAYLYFVQWSSEKESVEFSNPFELGPAIRFGLIYAFVLVVSRAAQVYFGNTGIYISSFVSGLADVNAIALSMVDLTQRGGGLASEVATRAIVIAAMANTLFKGVFALVTGSRSFRKALWPGLVLMLVAGTAVAFVM
ncbi:MAG: MgtC/SapB family protein [Anaerolineae bacterium]